MSPEARLENLSREELIALIRRLQEEIERLKRSGQRSAAPFSKGEPKRDPKPPGRKPGQGYFRFRTAPEQTPQEVIAAAVYVGVEMAGPGRSGSAIGLQQTVLNVPGAVYPGLFGALVGVSSWSVGFAVIALFPLAGWQVLRALPR